MTLEITPKLNHNSPQKPKTRFIHSKVVGLQLLTFGTSGKPAWPKTYKASQIEALLLVECSEYIGCKLKNWWRRWESNPRPKELPTESFHAFSVSFLSRHR